MIIGEGTTHKHSQSLPTIQDTTPKARELTRRDLILHTYNPQTERIAMYWKDASNMRRPDFEIIKSSYAHP